ncbi:protein phosphatase 2C domain-containing protein [Gemmata sp. JC673]|uniref:Protein phosphatase 2C domain-containing protein n=1 Tax=Gemmata algarum TaxID=2975278 RepID=A0ABU5EYB6_9BACT|nr:PP2C family serine/threonine-protein phosphatase [Gemmata algarum]MDY3560120.1 protein phosphatase 2C domain-containing protein [Gemmata algarum]
MTDPIWRTLGESVPGTSHTARSVPCQDAFRVCSYGPGGDWLLAAVADGAGSASRSDVGAELVCDEFVRLVTRAAPADLCAPAALVDLFAAVRSTVLARADALGVPPRELASTALLALVGPETAAFAQLGDGAIVCGAGDGYRVVFWPEPAEYANATDFLTDDGFAGAIRTEVVADRVTELAALTDGLQRLALDFAARAPHAGFFTPLFRRLRTEPDTEALFEPLRQFLNSPRVNERTDDDKTLVLAARRP